MECKRKFQSETIFESNITLKKHEFKAQMVHKMLRAELYYI